MSRSYTFHPSPDIDELDVHAPGSDLQPGAHGPDVDGNSVRWVFAATVLFWLLVVVAGQSYF